MALVGIDYLKTYLGITTTASDGQLQVFLDQASAAVTDYCGRDFLARTYPGAGEDGGGDNGIYCGDGSRFLVIRQRPITSIQSIYHDPSANFGTNPDGSFTSATLMVEGSDYVVHWDSCLPGTTTKASRCGIIERVGTSWPSLAAYTPGKLVYHPIPTRGTIKVSYTAGYTTIPHAIRNAVVQLAAFIRRNYDKGGSMTSESLGGYSYSLGSPSSSGQFPELGSIRAMLAKYVEIPV